MQVVSTVVATLSRTVQRFVLLITTVYTTVVSYIYKVLPDVVDTLIVPARRIVLQPFVGFVSILVRGKKTNIDVSKQDDIYG